MDGSLIKIGYIPLFLLKLPIKIAWKGPVAMSEPKHINEQDQGSLTKNL